VQGDDERRPRPESGGQARNEEAVFNG
jgi:hypothetical protein